MDPIDQRAIAARSAIDEAVADVAPQPFKPRSRRAGPALLGVAVILGGAFAANAALNGGASVETVATDSTSSTTALVTTTTAARVDEIIGSPAPVAATQLFVFDQAPSSLGQPLTFELPDEFDIGPQSFTIEVYGRDAGTDPFVDGDIGIMRATFMEAEDLDGDPLMIAGREVFADTSSEPGLIINWAEGNTMIGVASWTLGIDDLTSTVELLLADPTAEPAELPNGFVQVSATDDFLGGFAFGGGAGRVMYAPDVSRPGSPDAISVGVVEDATSSGGASWLMSGKLAEVSDLDGGLVLSKSTIGDSGPTDSGEQQITVFVPGLASDGRMVAVTAMGSGFSDDELIAAARTLRPATALEIETMATAGESIYGDIDEGEELPPLLDGDLADGRRLRVESNGRDMCVQLLGDPEFDECFESTLGPDFDADEEPEYFWSASESSTKNVFLLGFPVGDRTPGPAHFVVEFADGSTAPLEQIVTGPDSGRFGQYDQMPVAAVKLKADGSESGRSDLPEVELGADRTVMIVVMG